MRITQGTFGSLPDLTDEEVEAQLHYATANGWAVSIELTDDPDPRSSLWEMWCLPLFDLADPAPAMAEVRACRAAFPGSYVKVNCFDSARGKETIGLSFLVQRPVPEPVLAWTVSKARGGPAGSASAPLPGAPGPPRSTTDGAR